MTIRVAMLYSGLKPITDFDAIEIHEMAPSPFDINEMWQAEDAESAATAYSVQLHCRSGGVNTVRDFPFDPTEPGDARVAEQAANELAFSLADLLMASDEELTIQYVLGAKLAADPLARPEPDTTA